MLLRACAWKQQPLLAPLQFVLDTKRSIVQAPNPKGEVSLACLTLLPLLPEAEPRPKAVTFDGGDEPQPPAATLEPATRGGTLGQLSGAPALPSTFDARDELDGLRWALLGGNTGAVAVAGSAWVPGRGRDRQDRACRRAGP